MDTSMGQLIMRNVDDALVSRLKRRAARNGRSTEAEHRAILRAALTPKRRDGELKALLLAIPSVGRDRDFERVAEVCDK